MKRQQVWFIGPSAARGSHGEIRWRLANARGQVDIISTPFESVRAALVAAVDAAAETQLRIDSLTQSGDDLLLLVTPFEGKSELAI